MALDLQEGSVSSETSGSTRSVKQYWKTILAGLAAAASIATCIYFPPAALFLSPAVELLVGAMSFAGMWAGLVAFGAVVAGVATLSFAATRLLLDGVEALTNKLGGEAVNPAETQAETQAEIQAEIQAETQEETQAETQAETQEEAKVLGADSGPVHHTSPISQHEPSANPNEALSDDEEGRPGFGAVK